MHSKIMVTFNLKKNMMLLPYLINNIALQNEAKLSQISVLEDNGGQTRWTMKKSKFCLGEKLEEKMIKGRKTHDK